MNQSTNNFWAAIAVIALFTYPIPLVCQEKSQDAPASTTRFIRDPDRDWAREVDTRVIKLVFDLKPDAVANASWDGSILFSNLITPVQKIWIWLDSSGICHAHYRTTPTFITDQVQALHKSYPSEEIETLHRRLTVVDIDLDMAHFYDLKLADIAKALASISPPNNASLQAMNNHPPVDSWWEWSVQSALPQVNYPGTTFRDAVAHCIEKHWQPPPLEDGSPSRGMSTIREMNVLSAWTDYLFGTCYECMEKLRTQRQSGLTLRSTRTQPQAAGSCHPGNTIISTSLISSAAAGPVSLNRY